MTHKISRHRPQPPRSTLFPYTTLFRSREKKAREKATVQSQRITLEDYFAQGGAESKLKTLPVLIKGDVQGSVEAIAGADRKSTRLNSSHPSISYAVFCLKKKKRRDNQ